MITKIEYRYRDAGNYKLYGDLFVEGEITAEMIRPFLIDEEFFIPEFVGVKPLRPEITNDDDHMWHGFVSFDQCEEEAINPLCSAAELLERFQHAKLFVKIWQ